MNNESAFKRFTILVKTHKLHYLFIYFLLFYAVWTLHRSISSPYIYENYKGIEGVLINAIIKVLIWAVPVFIYIRYIDERKPMTFLKLNKRALIGLFWGILITLALVGVNLIKVYIFGKGKINIDVSLDNIINVVLITCITEEIVFRGFLLNKLEEFIEFWGANIIAAILFVTIHFPIWIMEGDGITLQKVISVMILGILFGYTYKKTDSLWSAILFHGANNFIVSALGIK
ncbi:MAG: type II CAAX endopeptidase family protein [Bacillota bacterium]|nr:type II CAAX endopeptidase family protein [Bacillota bacterium]